MIPKHPTFFLFINPPISSCKTYRTVVGVSDSLLSDPFIELRCFLLSIRKSTTSGSATFDFEPQALAAISWNERVIHLHCARKRKKRSGPSIKLEYRLELENVNTQADAKVVEEEFGLKFQADGEKIVFGDNDKKLHSDVSAFFSKKFYLSV